MAIFLRNGVSQEHFIPQMHLLVRKTPLITWLLWKKKKLKAPQTAKAVFCLPFGVFPLCIHPSLSFSPLYLICLSPTRLPHFLVPLQPLPLQVLPLIHHSSSFFLSFHVCIFKRRWARARCVETLGSVLVVFCVFNLLYQHPALGGGWGNAKTMRIQ